jgi:hypothetical protein
MNTSAHFESENPVMADIRSGSSRSRDAFTLLEVMIAMAIFFIAIFAILSVVASGLRNARVIQQGQVDPSLLMADLCQTNKLEDGDSQSGNFGDLYPDYVWSCDIRQIATNGLFQVDYTISYHGHFPKPDSHMSIYLWRPDSKNGGAFGGTGR